MKGKHALVVDDSKSARFAMRKFLESFGYEVDTAESAEDAFISLKSKRPDVVFLDHMMPGTNGFDALGLLKRDAHTAGLPVVLCSSNDGTDFVSQARAQGAVDVLVKPPSREQIGALLSHLQGAAPVAASVVVPMPLPATSSKVHPIREPGLTIENAVMKTLRDAMPLPTPPTPAPAPRPTANAAATTSPAPPAPNRSDLITPHLNVMRLETEQRLRRITQDLFVQLGETKAQVAHLDGKISDEEHFRGLITDAVTARTATLTRIFEEKLARLLSEVEGQMQAHSQRMDSLETQLRAAIREEAQSVSERAMMDAAARISDQIAESILKVLKPGSVKASA